MNTDELLTKLSELGNPVLGIINYGKVNDFGDKLIVWRATLYTSDKEVTCAGDTPLGALKKLWKKIK